MAMSLMLVSAPLVGVSLVRGSAHASQGGSYVGVNANTLWQRQCTQCFCLACFAAFCVASHFFSSVRVAAATAQAQDILWQPRMVYLVLYSTLCFRSCVTRLEPYLLRQQCWRLAWLKLRTHLMQWLFYTDHMCVPHPQSAAAADHCSRCNLRHLHVLLS